MQKTVPLQQLVTKPLCSYAKLLGKDGDLESHSKNHYHIAAVQAAFDFLRTYHNPAKEVVNQLSSNRSQQIHENRQRLIPIVETIVFLGRQNIAFRGHRDDGALLTERDKNTNDGNFRQLLKFRVNSGDKVLETHLKTVSARATYISKTVQNELIDCCGQEIVLDVLRRVHDSRFYSIMFDETTDVSHTSQMSLSLRYVHDGTVREDFVQFIDAYGEAYSDWDSAEKSEPVSSGTVLGERSCCENCKKSVTKSCLLCRDRDRWMQCDDVSCVRSRQRYTACHAARSQVPLLQSRTQFIYQ